MGLIRDVLGSRSPPQVMLQGNGDYALEVKCEGRHQATLERLAARKPDQVCEVPCRATLVPEQDRVSVTIKGETVGQLQNDVAPAFLIQAERLGLQASVACDAMIVGGWCGHDGEEGTFGVKLDLVWPVRLASK